MSQDVVRARRFELVDHEDRVRAKLEADVTSEYEGPVGLTILDAQGEARVRLLAGSDSSAQLTFSDSQGEMRATLMVFDDGTPGLSLFDNTGCERVNMRLSNLSSEPRLVLNDSSGVARAILSITAVESEQTGNLDQPGGLILQDSSTDAHLIAFGPTSETRAGIEIRSKDNELIKSF